MPENAPENTGTTPSTWYLPSKYWVGFVLSVLGGLLIWFATRNFHQSVQTAVAAQQASLLEASSQDLLRWHANQVKAADGLVDEFQAPLVAVIEQSLGHSDSSLSRLEGAASLASLLDRRLQFLQSRIALVTDKRSRLVLSSSPLPLGKHLSEVYSEAIEAALQGKPALAPPHRCKFALPTAEGSPTLNLPVLLLCLPLSDADDAIVGVLCLVYDSDASFHQRLQPFQSQLSSETYVINAEGLLLSQIRFEEEARGAGNLDSTESATLHLEVRDPIQRTSQDSQAQASCPLTHSAAAVATLAKKDSSLVQSSMQPYSNYLGVPVVGSWRWLPELNVGVITEIQAAEAFAASRSFARTLWSAFSLCLAALVGIALYSRWSKYFQYNQETTRLGQYELLEKIGEGGMGEVYRARHATLMRETAVKLIRTRGNEVALKRFEREVQLTCRLEHPNTIQVFDYGRTQEIFYYAMEMLTGISLEDLVYKTAPLTDGRCVHILSEVCWALGEAHESGVVHRDIKPSNIMLCQRGGVPDAVKVLDFGLARSLDGNSFQTVQQEGTVAGTPAYMSPEAAQTPNEVDQRSDVYSLGAVGYFLLTGKPPFVGKNPVETIWKHVRENPTPVQDSSPQPIALELAALVMQCLAKEPADRPTIREMQTVLRSMTPQDTWTLEMAEQWWTNK